MNKTELIYGLVNGIFDTDELEEKTFTGLIENEFKEGKPCEKWYDEIYQLKQKLSQRLGIFNEDEDLEYLVECYTKICEYLGMKMFEYGKLYGNL